MMTVNQSNRKAHQGHCGGFVWVFMTGLNLTGFSKCVIHNTKLHMKAIRRIDRDFHMTLAEQWFYYAESLRSGEAGE